LLQATLEAAFSGLGPQRVFLRAALLRYEQLLITILPPQHVCCCIDTAPLSLILLLVGGSDLPRVRCCRENNVFVQTHKIKTTRNHTEVCKNIHRADKRQCEHNPLDMKAVRPGRCVSYSSVLALTLSSLIALLSSYAVQHTCSAPNVNRTK